MDKVEAELQSRIELMTDKEKKLFKEAILRMSLCFGDQPIQGMMIFIGHIPLGAAEVLQFNCSDMDAVGILESATNYFNFLNTKDAPPKEMFN